MSSIAWNPEVQLIISDVDETIADLYVAAEPEMSGELIKLLEEGKTLFFVTGQGLKSVSWRVIEQIPQALRHRILVGHCSGVEVWGHDAQGNLLEKAFYSVYEDSVTNSQKKQWRDIIAQLISEFELKTFPATPITEFTRQAGTNPLSVMFEDRGPQITLEVINGYDLTPEQTAMLSIEVPETHGCYDLRIPLVERADELLQAAQLPITPRLAGEFAIDFAVKGVSKTTAVKHVIESEEILASLGLSKQALQQPKSMEIWGDKFSVIRGGSDRHMCEAVSPEVRTIDFRQEEPSEFMPGYNIVVWDGNEHLHAGTLEYLRSRKSP